MLTATISKPKITQQEMNSILDINSYLVIKVSMKTDKNSEIMHRIISNNPHQKLSSRLQLKIIIINEIIHNKKQEICILTKHLISANLCLYIFRLIANPKSIILAKRKGMYVKSFCSWGNSINPKQILEPEYRTI